MNTSKTPYLVLVFIVMLSLSACATASRGTTDYLRIDSVPQGAMVTTTLETKDSLERSEKNIRAKKQYVGCSPTPCAIKIARRKNLAIKIEHPDFAPADIVIGGPIKLQHLNVDMTSHNIANMGASIGGGAMLGATVGSMAVAYIEFGNALTSILSLGTATPTTTSGVVSGATASGAAIGLGIGASFIAVDMATGANHNIYPNPIVVKLAPKGAEIGIDPNLLMFNIQQAKKKLKYEYCRENHSVSAKRRKRNCEIAKKLDIKRDIKNAELLASEPEIKKLIKDINAEIKRLRAQARAKQRAARDNK